VSSLEPEPTPADPVHVEVVAAVIRALVDRGVATHKSIATSRRLAQAIDALHTQTEWPAARIAGVIGRRPINGNHRAASALANRCMSALGAEVRRAAAESATQHPAGDDSPDSTLTGQLRTPVTHTAAADVASEPAPQRRLSLVATTPAPALRRVPTWRLPSGPTTPYPVAPNERTVAMLGSAAAVAVLVVSMVVSAAPPAASNSDEAVAATVGRSGVPTSLASPPDDGAGIGSDTASLEGAPTADSLPSTNTPRIAAIGLGTTTSVISQPSTPRSTGPPPAAGAPDAASEPATPGSAVPNSTGVEQTAEPSGVVPPAAAPPDSRETAVADSAPVEPPVVASSAEEQPASVAADPDSSRRDDEPPAPAPSAVAVREQVQSRTATEVAIAAISLPQIAAPAPAPAPAPPAAPPVKPRKPRKPTTAAPPAAPAPVIATDTATATPPTEASASPAPDTAPGAAGSEGAVAVAPPVVAATPTDTPVTPAATTTPPEAPATPVALAPAVDPAAAATPPPAAAPADASAAAPPAAEAPAAVAAPAAPVAQPTAPAAPAITYDELVQQLNPSATQQRSSRGQNPTPVRKTQATTEQQLQAIEAEYPDIASDWTNSLSPEDRLMAYWSIIFPPVSA
jgi:hypothetical protein